MTMNHQIYRYEYFDSVRFEFSIIQRAEIRWGWQSWWDVANDSLTPLCVMDVIRCDIHVWCCCLCCFTSSHDNGNEALCFVEHWNQRNEENNKDVFAFADVSQTVTRMPTSLSKTKAWGLGWVVGVTCRDSRSAVIDLSYLSLSLFVIYDAPWWLMMSSEWVRQYEDCCGICSWWFVIGIISVVVVAVASPASNCLVGSSNHTPRLQAMACRTGTASVGPLQLQLSAFFQFNVFTLCLQFFSWAVHCALTDHRPRIIMIDDLLGWCWIGCYWDWLHVILWCMIHDWLVMIDAAANDDYEALRLLFMRLMRFMTHDEFGDGDDEDVDDTTDDDDDLIRWWNWGQELLALQGLFVTDLIAPVEHTDAQLANSAGNLFLGRGGWRNLLLWLTAHLNAAAEIPLVCFSVDTWLDTWHWLMQ